jgi:hypothetical protein
MMIMLAPFSGPWLVAPPKFIPGLEADTVMESITLIIRDRPISASTNRQRLDWIPHEERSAVQLLFLP